MNLKKLFKTKDKKKKSKKIAIISMLSFFFLVVSFFVYYKYSQASYSIISFTEVGNHNWTVPEGVTKVDVLVVAGGGGGGYRHAAGGGAGGLIYLENYSVTPGQTISVAVGGGGDGSTGGSIKASNGENSVFGGLTAIGGGAGGQWDGGHKNGSSGGSGGGSASLVNATGTSGQGNNGGTGATSGSPYNWGGGGGAGEAGGNATSNRHGSGGNGLYYGDKFGDSYGENGWFAGGGGGGGHNRAATVRGLGGNGGGGDGGTPNVYEDGESGLSGTGGGGGGASTISSGTNIGGNGGSGVVLIRYVDRRASTGMAINKGLVAHYTMNEIDYNHSNNRVTDKTPYENHGSNYGATFTEDRFGKDDSSFYFNESSYLRVPLDESFNFNNQSFTLSSWVKTTDTGGGIFDTQQTSYRGYRLTIENGLVEFGVYASDFNASYRELNSSILVNDGDWHLVVATYDKNTSLMSIYIDGQLDITSTQSQVAPSLQDLYIGVIDVSRGFLTGNLDDVRIYNRALSESEIQSLYDSYNPKTTTGTLQQGLVLDIPLKLKYTKDETPGSEIMTDRTPYSNDGQNYGAIITDEGASFNGINNHIDVGNMGALYDKGAVSFWINSAALESYRNPFTTNYAGVNTAIRFEENSSGRFLAIIGNDSGTYAAAVYLSSGLQINKWYHVVLVWDKLSNNIKGYLDGVSKFNQAHALWPTAMSAVSIGSGFTTQGERQWKGQVSNLKMYNRALSDEEVKTLYDRGRDDAGIIFQEN